MQHFIRCFPWYSCQRQLRLGPRKQNTFTHTQTQRVLLSHVQNHMCNTAKKGLCTLHKHSHPCIEQPCWQWACMLTANWEYQCVSQHSAARRTWNTFSLFLFYCTSGLPAWKETTDPLGKVWCVCVVLVSDQRSLFVSWPTYKTARFWWIPPKTKQH